MVCLSYLFSWVHLDAWNLSQLLDYMARRRVSLGSAKPFMIARVMVSSSIGGHWVLSSHRPWPVFIACKWCAMTFSWSKWSVGSPSPVMDLQSGWANCIFTSVWPFCRFPLMILLSCVVSVMVMLSIRRMIDPFSRLFQRLIVLWDTVPGWHCLNTAVSSYSGCCSVINPKVSCLPWSGSVSLTAGSKKVERYIHHFQLLS
jgi:hypothetical protein